MKDLTQGSVAKTLFVFALPLVLTNLLMQANLLIDTAIVGRVINKEALAAIGSVFPMIFVLSSIQIGLTVGGSVLIAQYSGEKNNAAITQTIHTLFTALFVVCITISLGAILFKSALFKLINLPADVLPYASIYMNIYFGGLVTIVLLNVITGFLRGMGNSTMPLYFAVISNVLNILFDLLFVLQFKWGIAGVAWASVLAQSLAGIIGYIWCYKKYDVFRISLQNYYFKASLLFKSLRIGLPTAAQQLALSFGIVTIFALIGKYGSTTMAAFTIGGRIDSFPGIITMELSAALMAFVGQNYGARQMQRIHKALLLALCVSLIVAIIMALLIWISPNVLLSPFTTDSKVIEAGSRYLMIIGSFYLMYSSIYIFGGIFQGMGKTLFPMVFTMTSLWAVRIPLCYYFASQMGETGIWWGIVTSWTFEALCCGGYYWWVTRKGKIV